jgi:hypothetical protein
MKCCWGAAARLRGARCSYELHDGFADANISLIKRTNEYVSVSVSVSKSASACSGRIVSGARTHIDFMPCIHVKEIQRMKENFVCVRVYARVFICPCSASRAFLLCV